MKINVKAATALRKYLPDGAVAGKIEIEVENESTPADVIRLLEIPESQRLMVIVDGEMVTRTELGSKILTDSQTLSLNPPIQAG